MEKERGKRTYREREHETLKASGLELIVKAEKDKKAMADAKAREAELAKVLTNMKAYTGEIDALMAKSSGELTKLKAEAVRTKKLRTEREEAENLKQLEE